MLASDILYADENLSNMNKALTAEERRLKSLKEKKQAFKNKEKLVQEALKNLDAKPQNKKIVFDDNVTIEQLTQTNRKRNALFDEDSDNENIEDYGKNFVDTGKSRAPKDLSEKRLKLQLRYGNDQRFILDERFEDDDEKDDVGVESQHKQETPEVADNAELDLEKEKDWQLNILGDVLGAPVTVKKDNTTTSTKKNRMIRYDPTEKGHEEYEIHPEHTETKSKKKAKRERAEAAAEQETPAVPTSNEMYYSVSDNITDCLKEPGKFSLLNTFGKNKPEPSSKQISTPDIPQERNKKFQFSLDSSKVFKYDSSDDEDNAEESNNAIQKEEPADDIKGDAGPFFKNYDTFFFSTDDHRFNDALKFFDPNTVSNEDFKSLRRELKQIVRAKVRNNAKKNQPWGKKRRIKKF